MMPPKSPENLNHLRHEIDRVDEALHALLIERGDIVERVIAAKAAAGSTGSAFRPAREAELMRALALRNRGRWPLETAENIWRVIVATSTYIQVPYSVHADVSGDATVMRESARFHFGYTVPFVEQKRASSVIEAVHASTGDLGMFGIGQAADSGAWWRGLVGAGRPKIIARLPFIERARHPVGIPVFVIAKPQAEGLARDEVVAALTIERWNNGIPTALEALGARQEASAGVEAGLSVLVTHPGTLAETDLLERLKHAGVAARYDEIGSHAARFHLNASD